MVKAKFNGPGMSLEELLQPRNAHPHPVSRGPSLPQTIPKSNKESLNITAQTRRVTGVRRGSRGFCVRSPALPGCGLGDGAAILCR